MKTVLQGISIAALALVAGCATPPLDLKPETPSLNIAAASKRPLKVAVVVQDPMAYTLFYQGVKSYSRDMTTEIRSGGFPLESELSKISAETFSQAFNQVVVLRDLPQPGQYDAVVNLSIGKVLMQEHVVLTGETCDVTAEWSMSVLDKQNKEVFSKKGVSPMHNFAWSAFNPRRGFILGIGSTMSPILGELAKEWGTTLYSLDLGH